MRTRLAIFLVLVAGIAASVVTAAPDKATSPFVDEVTSIGIVGGSATLDPTPQGEVMLHAKLNGLEPGITYELVILQEAVACGSGVVIEAITFQANPAGVANLNRKVAADIANIGSVAVRFPGVDPTLVACADF